jgi:hypothetical protein
MSINFPDSPTTGQEFTAGQRKWVWDGRAWEATTVNVGYTGSAGSLGRAIVMAIIFGGG